ncbi:MAG: N-acetylmuramoyl-L-alanine amidase [Lachnospiraceae bacterium]|nr:N-acetylmuramoyl-L-alanine amidase [Lachnospiraceae bacterium]
MAIKINERLAKSVSYGNKRDLSLVKYIVIHYTGNKGDTAKNNAAYFANGNTRAAGAHFFVDKQGEIWKSINIDRIAWAVGGFYGKNDDAGSYYQKCTNTNSISIELCDCLEDTNWEQMKATRQLVQYIQKKCPNAKTIIRHWDVNGKKCPAPMAGANNEKWKRFHSFLVNGYQFKAKVTKKAAIRSSGKVTAENKIGTAKKGTVVRIAKVVVNWGRLKEKSENGKYQWISLKKLEEL